MHKTATAHCALLALCALLLAACGGSGSSATKTATLPGGTLGASTAPPRLGFYSGMECIDHACSHFTDAYARPQARASCKHGLPVDGKPSSFAFDGHDEYFVCFSLPAPNGLVDFYADGQRIVRQTHVSANRFPLTCENGWCVSGEWSAPSRIRGTIRNPNGLTTQYAAEWVAGP